MAELNDNILTIEGERKQEKRDERAGWSERSYGTFFRSIALPEGAPQRQQQHGRQIEIK